MSFQNDILKIFFEKKMLWRTFLPIKWVILLWNPIDWSKYLLVVFHRRKKTMQVWNRGGWTIPRNWKKSSPSWELELRPLGVATGNASSVTRVWRYICKNTTCWPATAHDVTTGVSQYKCRREHTSSAFSSSLTGLFEETCILVGIQFSFIYHGEH